MGAVFELTLNTKDTARAIQQLKERALPAIARALNRSAASAKTAMVRVIAEDLGLKVGDVRDHVIVRDAKPEQLRATFYASAKRIPLIDFRAKGPEPSRGKGRGVTAKLAGGQGRYPRAFISTMKSGHRGVFQRTGKARLPVTELHGPSIRHTFVKHVQVGIARGEEQLVKNLRSELRFAMSRTS
jgi:hypothetical protein